MKVSDLREQLQGMPGDAEIVVPASDHEYRKACVDLTTAQFDGRTFSEDFAGGALGEACPFGKRVQVLLFGY